MRPDLEYDVAISFAGEDRAYAESLASALRDKGLRVFYDRFETANMWGKDLSEFLHEVYSGRARFCVPITSQYYISKPFPRHERRSAQSRALRQDEEYLLPIRLDATQIPGFPDTLAYIDASQYTVDQIVDMLLDKLERRSDGWSEPTKHSTGQVNASASAGEISDDPRFERHQKRSPHIIQRLEGVGYFAFHSVAPVGTQIFDAHVKNTFLNPSRRYSEALNLTAGYVTHPDGYTKEYRRLEKRGRDDVTEATSCYLDGYVVTEGYLDPDLSNETWVNPSWLIYKLQRHLQLTKEVFESVTDACTLYIAFEQLESTTWAVFRGHTIYKQIPYGGYHDPIVQPVLLSEIHGRDKWNTVMDVAVQAMEKIARIYGMDSLPNRYWNSDGHLDYVKGVLGLR